MTRRFFDIALPIWLILAKGPGGLPEEEVLKVFEKAKERFSEVGYRAELKRFTVMNDIPGSAKLNSPSQIIWRLNKWRTYLKKKGALRPRILTHVILPPMEGGYMAGVTHTCSRYTRHFLSISNMKLVGPGDETRIPHDETVLEHEGFHNLGAHHISEPPNIMHPNALYYVNAGYPLPILDLTKAEIDRCEKQPRLGRHIRRQK